MACTGPGRFTSLQPTPGHGGLPACLREGVWERVEAWHGGSGLPTARTGAAGGLLRHHPLPARVRQGRKPWLSTLDGRTAWFRQRFHGARGGSGLSS